jgi:hypothetical protein
MTTATDPTRRLGLDRGIKLLLEAFLSAFKPVLNHGADVLPPPKDENAAKQ